MFAWEVPPSSPYLDLDHVGDGGGGGHRQSGDVPEGHLGSGVAPSAVRVCWSESGECVVTMCACACEREYLRDLK